jgi:hypothetical protein
MNKPVSRVAVWIDQTSAHIVELKADGTAKTSTLTSDIELVAKATGHVTNLPPHGIGAGLGGREHTSAERRREREMAVYFDRVAAKVAKADELLIMGHGEAPSDFASAIRRQHPGIQIRAVEGVDRMTEAQLVAHAREKFRLPAERLMAR